MRVSKRSYSGLGSATITATGGMSRLLMVVSVVCMVVVRMVVGTVAVMLMSVLQMRVRAMLVAVMFVGMMRMRMLAMLVAVMRVSRVRMSMIGVVVVCVRVVPVSMRRAVRGVMLVVRLCSAPALRQQKDSHP